MANSSNSLRRWHGLSAALILVFITAHIANHISLIWGFPEHQQIMSSLRNIYRYPVVETLLMLALAWQIISGSAMVVRGWKTRSGLIGWAQALSGIYLILFLLNHVSAVWYGRLALDLDTDIRFAAAGFHAGYAAFFIPYYFLGVLALFTHIACAVYWLASGSVRRYAPAALMLAGLAIGGMAVAVMASEPVTEIRYLQTYMSQ